MQFQNIVTATIKAKKVGSTSMLSIPGVTAGTITPEEAATQINKLIAVADWAVVADSNMKRVVTQEAI